MLICYLEIFGLTGWQKKKQSTILELFNTKNFHKILDIKFRKRVNNRSNIVYFN